MQELNAITHGTNTIAYGTFCVKFFKTRIKKGQNACQKSMGTIWAQLRFPNFVGQAPLLEF
jgi:hypothetical protein